jgi:hypothetical protein
MAWKTPTPMEAIALEPVDSLTIATPVDNRTDALLIQNRVEFAAAP